MTDKPSLAQEIDKQMRDLPFDFDEAKMLQHFVQKSIDGMSPEATARELVAAFDAREEARDPIKIVKNSAAVRRHAGDDEVSYSIGKSKDGFHYQINEWSMHGAPDREGRWSQAFPTQEHAEIRARQEVRDEIGRAIPAPRPSMSRSR